jgi:hypothetical protein
MHSFHEAEAANFDHWLLPCGQTAESADDNRLLA